MFTQLLWVGRGSMAKKRSKACGMCFTNACVAAVIILAFCSDLGIKNQRRKRSTWRTEKWFHKASITTHGYVDRCCVCKRQFFSEGEQNVKEFLVLCVQRYTLQLLTRKLLVIPASCSEPGYWSTRRHCFDGHVRERVIKPTVPKSLRHMKKLVCRASRQWSIAWPTLLHTGDFVWWVTHFTRVCHETP